ncbi:MAG: cob(I)yrinic acid a,c-diamide adenosyltransferase [Chloroflexi bacterium]|nr:cob(I)yrinic acid a,c-diamide adenosyltransferase [Chloroflexota bacterium]
MKIYTKTGDGGTTALFAGGRVPKHHLRVEAYGTVDELNSLLGVVRATGPSQKTDAWLEIAQNQLFHLGSDLATPPSAKTDWVTRIGKDEINWLEAGIDQMTDLLPPLRNFVLPGGSPAGAQLQVARAVCRRAERIMTALDQSDEIGPDALVYVNRLSDWLFMLARYENRQAGESETKWSLQK